MDNELKIALCFSGLPRSIKECYPSIYKYLIEPNNIKDIFVHTWECEDGEDIGNIMLKQIYKKSDTLFLKEKYKPKEYLKEPHTIIYEQPNYIKEEKLDKYVIHTKNLIGLQCMFYSIYKSFELITKYQEKHNFIYDYVIRLRFDMIFFDSIIINDLDSNALHVFDNNNRDEYPDEFAIGNYENMKKYSETWNNLQIILDSNAPYQNDTLLSQNIKNYGIPVQNLENIFNPIIRKDRNTPKLTGYCHHPDSIKYLKDTSLGEHMLKLYEDNSELSMQEVTLKSNFFIANRKNVLAGAGFKL